MMNSAQIVLLFALAFYSCDNSEYGNAVKKDSQRQFKLHKEFFKALSFSGIITDKKLCESCNLNKYQITIELEMTNPVDINIGDMTYQPYYIFNGNKQLTISVVKSLYENAIIGLPVSKNKGSHMLELEEHQFYLLDEAEMKWLPN